MVTILQGRYRDNFHSFHNFHKVFHKLFKYKPPLPNFFGKGGALSHFRVVQIRFSASSKSAGVSTLRKGAVSSRGMYTVLAQLSRLRMS